MYRKTHRFVPFILALVALMAAAQANAQTTANGPYYATPSWDQKLQCDTPSTCPRFIVLANWSSEAVLDRETGLVWERTPGGEGVTWTQAMSECSRLTKGGRAAWRLASPAELMSLYDPTAPGPLFLPPGHPFVITVASIEPRYWSTLVRRASGFLEPWIVLFDSVNFSQGTGDDFHHRRWCVRGESVADQ